MNITIFPGKLSGSVTVIPSKSLAHRFLICAAFADAPTDILCAQTNEDIEATAQCLNAIGAEISRTTGGYHIEPVKTLPVRATLPCGESGSTLRFLLPVVGALGIDATFTMEGRLPQRPLSPLWEEMERMGCSLSRPAHNRVRCQGRLRPSKFRIDGGVSSQFVTGLLFALSLIDGKTDLQITGKIESKTYIHMTKAAMDVFHAPHYRSPGRIEVEGDWSSGAFWLAASALGSSVRAENLCTDSIQGDRIVAALLSDMDRACTVDAADIPDLVPVLSVVAAAKAGAVFTNIRRLRLKESDRVASVISMVQSLGGRAEATEDTLIIHGTGLTGGTVDPQNDHRIAMAAAIGATVCRNPVTILNAHCVNKSYPAFWDEYAKLGGKYEQYLR